MCYIFLSFDVAASWMGTYHPTEVFVQNLHKVVNELVDGQLVLWTEPEPVILLTVKQTEKPDHQCWPADSPHCLRLPPRCREQHTGDKPVWSPCTPRRNTGTRWRQSQRLLGSGFRFCSTQPYLVLLAAQATADGVGLQGRSPAQLHRLVVPGQSGLTLLVHHQHKPDHPAVFWVGLKPELVSELTDLNQLFTAPEVQLLVYNKQLLTSFCPWNEHYQLM